MYKCIFCGENFAKKINYGRHLTVHKNISLNIDENDVSERGMNEENRIIGEDENDMIIEDENDMIGEDEGFKSQEENYLDERYSSQDSDLNDDFNDRQENNVFMQQFDKEDKNNFQMPYNLISEECYDFVQLVTFKTK